MFELGAALRLPRAASLICTDSPYSLVKCELVMTVCKYLQIKQTCLADILDLRASGANLRLLEPRPGSRVPAEDSEWSCADFALLTESLLALRRSDLDRKGRKDIPFAHMGYHQDLACQY